MASKVLGTHTDLILDSTARLRMSGQNRFRCLNVVSRTVRTASQSINSGADTAIEFTADRVDTDANHDTVSNTTRLTCTLAGKYLIYGNVVFEANATGFRQAYFRRNGGADATQDYLCDQRQAVASASTSSALNICTVATMAANDYVELFVSQNSGGALNVTAANDSSTNFGMVYLGE